MTISRRERECTSKDGVRVLRRAITCGGWGQALRPHTGGWAFGEVERGVNPDVVVTLLGEVIASGCSPGDQAHMILVWLSAQEPDKVPSLVDEATAVIHGGAPASWATA